MTRDRVPRRDSQNFEKEVTDELQGLALDAHAFIAMRRGLTTTQAALFLGLKPHSMENDRCAGRGPPYHKIGRSVRYDLKDLVEFRAASRRRSTSDQGGTND